MAYLASVEDGKVTSSYTKTELDGKIKKEIKDSKTPGGELDKEAFLQLLVAQMQYQDPLEPTDNTQYISQLASFSSLEQMQNMSASLSTMSTASDLQRATALLGTFVTVDDNGASVTGKVDTVEIKDGQAYLSINGTSYPLSALKEAADSEYLEAGLLSAQFSQAIKALPEINTLTTSDQGLIANLANIYENLNDYQKSFINPSDLATYKKYLEKLQQLLVAEKESSDKNKEEMGINDTEKTEA